VDIKIYLRECSKCGDLSPISADAMDDFCEHCGKLLDEEDRLVSICGTPYYEDTKQPV